MTPIRRLAYLALSLGFAQVVFGAVVRITGSGMGCGDNWPDCLGSFTPASAAPGLLIEISHRYGAVALSLAVLALIVAAFLSRRVSGVGGPGGVLRPAVLAGVLVLAAAIFGAITVKLELHAMIVVTHLAIAMALLAVLVVVLVRAGGFGARKLPVDRAPRTFRAARIAVALTFTALLLGALTANVAGAAIACQGFPWCRVIEGSATPVGIHVTHRVVAFLLLGHLVGMAIGTRKRGDPRNIQAAVMTALGLVILQVLVAAGMVEMHLPATLRSVHQAVGTALWISVVAAAALSRARPPIGAPADVVRESPSRAEFARPEGVST
ncbi:MAG TPA: COX15/CtaA family protein [Gemmatimonadaceae bacterium]|nr:COX15/CtaA family protein [Gemmatimonadaceae bacterium]